MSLACTHRDVKRDAECYVADTPGPAIVGLPSRRALQLVTMHCEISSDKHNSAIITKEDLRKSYPERFENNWKFDGEFRTTTDRNMTPVVRYIYTTDMSDSYTWRNQLGARKHGVASGRKEKDRHPTNRLGVEQNVPHEVNWTVENLRRPERSEQTCQASTLQDTSIWRGVARMVYL